MDALHFAHISDTHLVCSGSSEFMHQVKREVRDPKDTLVKCLKELGRSKLDFLLLTGDLIHEGEREDYAAYRQLLDAYLPGVPLCVALGNHDHRDAFRQGFLNQPDGSAGAYLATQMVQGLRVVSLDSPYIDGLAGSLPDDQLDYLESAVARPAPRGTILILHHPVTAIQPWARMAAPARFARILQNSDIKAVFNGHLHSNYVAFYGGVPHFTGGSLAFGIDMAPDRSIYTDHNTYALCAMEADGTFAVHHVTAAPATRVLKEKIMVE